MATVITNLLAHSEFLNGLITGALLGAIALCALVLLSHRFTRWLDARDAVHRASEADPFIVVDGPRTAAALRASGRRVPVAQTPGGEAAHRRREDERQQRYRARDQERFARHIAEAREAAGKIDACAASLTTREAH